MGSSHALNVPNQCRRWGTVGKEVQALPSQGGGRFPVVAAVIGALSLSIEFLGVIVVEVKHNFSTFVAFK
jgi:hypothetical protein